MLSSTSQPPSGCAPHQDVGDHRLRQRRVEGERRLRVERPDLGDHLGEVFAVDAADPHQRRAVARRQQRDCRAASASPDRAGRGRAAAAPGTRRGRGRRRRSDRTPAARASTALDPLRRAAEPLGDASELAAQVAGLVEQVDQMERDDRSAGSWMSAPICSMQMLAQRARPRGVSARCRAVVARRSAAPLCRLLPQRSAAVAAAIAGPSPSIAGGVAPSARRHRRLGRRPAAGNRIGQRLAGVPVAVAVPRSRRGVGAVVAPSRSSRSSSGFCSSSRLDKSASSRFDSCSSLIACCSCGVITSDWLCRSSSRCEKPICSPCSVRSGLQAETFAKVDAPAPRHRRRSRRARPPSAPDPRAMM